MAAGNCAICGRYSSRRERGDRCPTCANFLRDNDYDRPDSLIVRAAQRDEKRGGIKLDVAEDDAMTREHYTGPGSPWPECLCGCGRIASSLHGGLAVYCAQLAEHRRSRNINA